MLGNLLETSTRLGNINTREYATKYLIVLRRYDEAAQLVKSFALEVWKITDEEEATIQVVEAASECFGGYALIAHATFWALIDACSLFWSIEERIHMVWCALLACQSGGVEQVLDLYHEFVAGVEMGKSLCCLQVDWSNVTIKETLENLMFLSQYDLCTMLS